MKVTLGIKETNYGSIEVEVETNASKDDIEEEVFKEVNEGRAFWNKSFGKITDIIDCEDDILPCISFDRFREPAPKDIFKEFFIKELDNIHITEWKEAVMKMIDNVPEYFWEVPASSSGKYHPECSLGEAGLVRHSILVERIALDLLITETFIPKTPELESAVAIASLFHDVMKQGDNAGHTVFEHPVLGSKFIRENLKDHIPSVYLNLICHAVERHMGKWITSEKSDIVLEKPVSAFDKLIHIADYTASLKYTNGLKEWERFMEV